MESQTEHSYIHLHKFIETVLFCASTCTQYASKNWV